MLVSRGRRRCSASLRGRRRACLIVLSSVVPLSWRRSRLSRTWRGAERDVGTAGCEGTRGRTWPPCPTWPSRHQLRLVDGLERASLEHAGNEERVFGVRRATGGMQVTASSSPASYRWQSSRMTEIPEASLSRPRDESVFVLHPRRAQVEGALTGRGAGCRRPRPTWVRHSEQ
jgi:hypothetical protein